MADLVRFEQRFGYTFKNRKLLEEAFTHPTFARERELKYDNQRLEFLGDAVLEIILTRAIFERYRDAQEGQMTKMRSVLVREATLAQMAREMQMPQHLLMGRGEMAGAGYERDSTLCDLFEAFWGALFLDAGLTYTQTRVLDCFEAFFPDLSVQDDLNPKGRLQEYCVQHKLGFPRYELVEVLGPDHMRSYTVKLFVNEQYMGEGKGVRRKIAESNIAQKALDALTHPSA